MSVAVVLRDRAAAVGDFYARTSGARGSWSGSRPAPVSASTAHGQWYRTDMGWRQERVLGEADGRIKYTDPQVLWDEKRRQDAILATGEWRSPVRWTAQDVWRTPDRFLQRVRRALTS